MKIADNKAVTIDAFIHKQLNHIYPEREVKEISFLLFEAFLGWRKTDFITKKETAISESEILQFFSAVKRLKKHEPIQYVLGFAWFDDLKLTVTPDVLIPRQETEELVNLIAKENNNSAPKILDIGTGSGCIALALKNRLLISEIYAVDISEKAIAVATKNAEDGKLNVDFQQRDILNEREWRGLPNFDIIVSNPPYVLEKEKELMQTNVLEYEPNSALFVKDAEPLLYYKAIAKFANQHLYAKGKLYFEINEQKASEILEMLKEAGLKNSRTVKDLNGKDRMIYAEK